MCAIKLIRNMTGLSNYECEYCSVKCVKEISVKYFYFALSFRSVPLPLAPRCPLAAVPSNSASRSSLWTPSPARPSPGPESLPWPVRPVRGRSTSPMDHSDRPSRTRWPVSPAPTTTSSTPSPNRPRPPTSTPNPSSRLFRFPLLLPRLQNP